MLSCDGPMHIILTINTFIYFLLICLVLVYFIYSAIKPRRAEGKSFLPFSNCTDSTQKKLCSFHWYEGNNKSLDFVMVSFIGPEVALY
jgi:hypothetical protein